MNGERLVAEAAKLIAKGESYYHQAAEKIEQAAERGIPNTEIATGLSRSEAWVRALRNWHAQGSQSTALPFSEEQGAVAKRHARSVLRGTPEQVAEILDTPEVRANVTKALDTHYRERATKAASERRERRVEDRGGEEAHVEHEHRQRLSELVNVMRGAVSALRFAASQAKGLDLASDDTGAAEELTELVEEIVGFGSMLQEYLAGRSITDEDIALLIGGK